MPLPIEMIPKILQDLQKSSLQEKVLNFFLAFCKILQESCRNMQARFLQDPTKC